MKLLLSFIFFICLSIQARAFVCTEDVKDNYRAEVAQYIAANSYCSGIFCTIVKPTGDSYFSGDGSEFVRWGVTWPYLPSDYYIQTTHFRSCSNLPVQSKPPTPPVVCAQKGSVIHPHNQNLGQSLPVVGAPFQLNYFTTRVRGRVGVYQTTFDVREVVGARQSYQMIERTTFTISDISGSIITTITVLPDQNSQTGYAWTNPTGFAGKKFFTSIDEDYLDNTSTRYTSHFYLGEFRAEVLGLGGWYPDHFYFYDFELGVIYNPDGTKRTVAAKEGPGTNEFFVADESGELVYIFNNLGFHKRTVTGLLGSTLYSFEYNTDWSLDRINSRSGQYTQFNRNMSGQLVSITSDSGKVSTVTLTTDGYLQSITDPLSKTFSMTYDGTQGILTSFQKPTLELSEYTYDTTKNLTLVEHSSGKRSELDRTSLKDNDFSLDYIVRDGLTINYVNQNRSNSSTGLGRSKIETPLGVSEFNKTADSFTATYPTYSVEEYSTVDPRFGDQVRNTTSVYSNQLGPTTIDFFSVSATLSTSTDPWSITQFAKEKSYNDTTDTFRTINSVFTPSTKTWLTTSSMGRSTTTVLDADERPISIKSGNLHPTTFTYEMDQVKTVAQTSARTTTYNYDSTTRKLTSIVNPLNQTTSFFYDNNERLISKTFPDLNVVQFQYDNTGRLTGITPPSRPQHVFTINSQEQVGFYLAPTQTQGFQYTYDYDNKLTSITNPNSVVKTFSYHSTAQDLVSIETPSTTITYNRNATTRQIQQVVHSSGFRVNQSFSRAQLKSQEILDPNYNILGETQYFFNSRGQLGSFDFRDTYGASATTYLTYNADELPTAIGDMSLNYSAMPNGLLNQTVLQTLTENITTSDFEEVVSRNVTDGTNTYLTEDLVRDNLGRITQRVMSVSGLPTVTYNYVYNSRGQLIEVQDAMLAWIRKYTYDDNGNRLTMQTASPASTVNYTTNSQDQLTSSGVYTYTYNLNGEILTRTNTLLSQTRNYVYDDFGNLKQVTLENSDIISYDVDGLNRRVSKKKNNVVQRYYVWMENKLMAELNSDRSLLRRYIYATKSHVPDYYVEAGVNYKIITDAIGSVVMVVKASDGTITQTLEYDEFGRVLQDSRSGELAIGFAGGLSDWDTKLVRFGARDYDPSTGRWTSKDPILFEGGDANLYGYVENDPINWIDPEGMSRIGDKRSPLFNGGGYPGGGGRGGAVGGGGTGRPFNANQRAVIDLAKQAERSGGINRCEANQLQKWADEYNIGKNLSHPAHPGSKINFPHLHIGPIDHIPVK